MMQKNAASVNISEIQSIPQKTYTVKPVFKDNPRDHKIMAAEDMWSLFRGHLCNKDSKRDPKRLTL